MYRITSKITPPPEKKTFSYIEVKIEIPIYFFTKTQNSKGGVFSLRNFFIM